MMVYRSKMSLHQIQFNFMSLHELRLLRLVIQDDKLPLERIGSRRGPMLDGQRSSPTKTTTTPFQAIGHSRISGMLLQLL